MTYIIADNLNKQYGKGDAAISAVQDINFEIDYRCKYVPSGATFRGVGDPFFYLNGGNEEVNDAGVPVDSANTSVTAPSTYRFPVWAKVGWKPR